MTPVARSPRERAIAVATEYQANVESWLLRTLVDDIEKALTEAVAEERDACAETCEAMIIGARSMLGGEQRLAADVLTAAAKHIRARST